MAACRRSCSSGRRTTAGTSRTPHYGWLYLAHRDLETSRLHAGDPSPDLSVSPGVKSILSFNAGPVVDEGGADPGMAIVTAGRGVSVHGAVNLRSTDVFDQLAVVKEKRWNAFRRWTSSAAL